MFLGPLTVVVISQTKMHSFSLLHIRGNSTLNKIELTMLVIIAKIIYKYLAQEMQMISV
jgi:hypothetical protein